jgi:hypothetical protein
MGHGDFVNAHHFMHFITLTGLTSIYIEIGAKNAEFHT